MQEEQDTCRICSAPAEPDQPLFHPCKCSGTIRYIHQDCLTEWLAHSKKKTCDLCKHPYSFTKVYSKNMPERLPFLLIMRQFSRQVVSAILFGLRAALVATVWLAVLPLATIWTWRMYFMMGSSAAWWISALDRPSSYDDLYTITPTNTTAVNATSAVQPSHSQRPAAASVFALPLYKSISSDIFSGQIIASIIVLTFVAIFLLREWITQNARPGVFEDGEVPAEAADAVPPVPDIPQAIPPAPQALLAPPPLRRPPSPPPVVAEPAHDGAIPIRDHRYGRPQDDLVFQTRMKKPRTREDIHLSDDSKEASSSHRAKGKRRAHTTARDERRSLKSRRLRRPRTVEDEESLEESTALHEDKDFRRLRYVVRRAEEFDDELRRGSFGQAASAEPDRWPPDRTHNRTRQPNELPAFSEFTFRAPGPSYPSSSQASWGAYPYPPGFVIPYKKDSDPPAYDPSAPLRPPRDTDSDDDERDRTPTRPSTPVLGSSSSAKFDLNGNGQAESLLRRPALPTVTLTPSPIPSTSKDPGQTSHGDIPLESPNLATYRAPEELDAEPDTDYFVREYIRDLRPDDFIDPETVDEEQDRYFRDPQDEEDEANVEALRQRSLYAPEEFYDEEGNGEDMDTDEEDAMVRREIALRKGWHDNAGDGAAADMADEELDDEPDEVQWTDDDPGHDEEDDEGGEDIVRIREEVAAPPLARGGGGGPERRELRVVFGQPPEPPPQDDFDQEVNIDDDMDGALEAIGLRGPLVGVLQNAMLMIFILDTTIGLGIFLPFTIGKSTALLTLNPRRAAQLLHLPLRLIRLITDPLVDTVLLLVSRLLVPPLARLGHMALQSGLHGVANVIGQDNTDKLREFSSAAYGRVWEVTTLVIERSTSSPVSGTPAPKASTSYLYRVLEEDTKVMQLVEPYFAPIGKNVREWSEEGKVSWVRFATNDTAKDRAAAVVLGYAMVGLLLAIYLNILTVGSMRSAGRAVRNAVRQQLLVVKVAMFIVVELVIFPLGCGVMLDVCTVWLFPQGSFRSRAAFLMYAPLTAVFYHWVLGTMFMYQFAVLLSGCRGIMRPGAMWFIKDPQDQNFHPIRDILERPTLVQIRKLILSGMMYGFVVASGVATVSGILRVFSRTIMPFRWRIREPLSEVPIDLILLQMVLPYTMETFRPRKVLRRFGLFIWKYLASRLRLSSYMFGGRYASEEFTPKSWSWRSLLLQNGMEMDDAEALHDGTFRRVPNSDNIALVRESPATAEVLDDGTPVNEEAKKLIDAQNAEAQKAKRPIKDDYTVVYIPPDFKYRVISFLLFLWITGSIMLASVLAAPILLGRGFFRLFVSHDVHDGYSFIVGFYLLWGCWLIGAALDRMDKRRQRRWSDAESHAEWPLFVVKRTLLWTAQALYMALALGVIIPTLVGLVFELYIVQPIRHTANPLMEPRIRVVDMWALGLLYSKIIIHSLRMHPPAHGMMRGIDRVLRNGWTHLDPLRATKDVIAPLTAGLLGMIILPGAALWGITHFVTLPMDGDFLFLHVYPGIFTAAGVVHACFALSKIMSSWSQTIRDKEFLVEMRLRNLEAASEKKAEEQAEAKLEVATETED